MTKERVEEWMKSGREIEFVYKGKQYSLSPFVTGSNERWVSFCEYYQHNLDAKSVDDLWCQTYNGVKVSDILYSVPESEVDIY